MSELFTAENIVALATLTGLEIVLGIDNIVFIAILVGKLPHELQSRARRIGLFLAMFTRILLLLLLGWIMGLSEPLFYVPKFWTLQLDLSHGISGRDLILLLGGLFLIGKATYEIHDKLEGKHESTGAAKFASFPAVIAQVVLIDIVFSLDSVITAVGMVKVDPEAQWIGLSIMISAVILAIFVMLLFAGMIAAFVEKHPTMKMLALSFLLLIGVTLVTEGFHVQIPKGYVYFAMAFSLGVEIINLRMRKLTSPVVLQQSYVDAPPGSMSDAMNEPPAR
jgi:predicted tellurium resistance membrane protein TerC